MGQPIRKQAVNIELCGRLKFLSGLIDGEGRIDYLNRVNEDTTSLFERLNAI